MEAIASAGQAADVAGRAAALELAADWEPAAELHARLFRYGAESGSVALLTDASRSQARVRRWQGRLEEAEELAELSREVAERAGLHQAAARAINMLAAILHHRAELDGARALYTAALERAREVRDDELIGSVCQNLGIIANVQGDLREARALYLESLGSTVRSGNARAAVSTYNNLGMVCSDLQEWMEAEVCFRRGIEIAEQQGNATLLASLCANRAEPLIGVGDLDRALETLDRAEAESSRLEGPGPESDVARMRGVVARRRGDLRGANQHLSQALLIAAKAGQELERAEALEELAYLRREEGRTAEARPMLREARQGYRALGAARDAARVEGLLAAWETESLLADWGTAPGGEARAGLAPGPPRW